MSQVTTSISSASALFGDGLNSFLISLMPSESRGHSQEKESLAQLVALVRDLRSPDLTSPDFTSPDLGSLVAAACCCRAGFPLGTGTFSTSLFSETCCTCRCLAVKAAAMVERRSCSR